LAAHAKGSYIGAFYMIAGPLQQRLTAMGGSTNREIAATLHSPEASKNSRQWANNMCRAHAAAKLLQQSFTPEERHAANSLSPIGNTIFSAGDPTSVIEDLPLNRRGGLSGVA
jgi:hypothetical protein